MTAPASISVTFFDDYTATTKRQQQLSLPALAELIKTTSAAEKARLPWLKLAQFGNLPTEKNSLRWDGNVQAVDGVEADYDGGVLSFEAAVEIAEKAGVLAIIYTSPSHSPAAPRWRALCPFSGDLPPGERQHMMGRLNGLYAGIFAAESWTLSQSYYFGSVNGNPEHQVEIVDGLPIDQLEELDKIWRGKPDTVVAAADGNGQFHSGPLDEAALIEAIVSGERYHQSCVRLVGRWAQQGVAFLDAQARLFGIFDDVFPLDRDARWKERRADVPRIIRDIYGKQAAKLDAGGANGPYREPPADFDTRGPPAGPRERAQQANGANDDLFDLAEWDFGEDNEPIPPRGWLLGNLLCRQFLTSIFGDGAVGKTAIMIAMALSLTTGRDDLIGEHVFMRCRVLLVCFEDGKDELRRRLIAVMLRYGISKADIRGYLFIATISRADAKLANTRGGELHAGKLGFALDQAILRRKVDAAFLDPFVKTHSVGENDNTAIDFVVKILSDLAIQHDIAICSPHHTRKGPADPGNADIGRGAGSLKDAFRVCYTLSSMTQEEAEGFGVNQEDRRSLIRLDSGKVNLVRRSANARWFKLVGVPIGNATELYPRGDEIQTVERWNAPDLFAGLDAFTSNKLLDRIEAGPYQGGRYSPAANAKDRAAWPVVIELFPKLTPQQAKKIISTWIINGVLLKRDHEDPKDRHEHVSLFVGKRPGDTWKS